MELPRKVQIDRWKIVKLSVFSLFSIRFEKQLLLMPSVNLRLTTDTFEFVIGDPEKSIKLMT